MNDYVDAINGLIDIMDDLKSAIDDIDTDIVSLDATINNIKSTCQNMEQYEYLEDHNGTVTPIQWENKIDSMLDESNTLIEDCESFTEELTGSYTILLVDIANIHDEMVSEYALAYEEVESEDQNNSSKYIVLFIVALVSTLCLVGLRSVIR